jgi:hypothetical protein
MDSRGLDAVNMHVDDVLSPKRQQEIEQFIERLVAFAPTKVAIESTRWSKSANERYKQYLAGTAKLTPNEIDQIGFRLAKKRNLVQITPVDFPMLDARPDADRAAHAEEEARLAAEGRCRAARRRSGDKEVRAEVAKNEGVLASSTISDYLAYINSLEQAALHHRWDVIYNLAPGDGPILYANTDRATNWYKRNVRIFTNLLEAKEPGDRVLVMFNVAHAKLLRDFASEHPAYCLVDAVAYLKGGDAERTARGTMFSTR